MAHQRTARLRIRPASSNLKQSRQQSFHRNRVGLVVDMEHRASGEWTGNGKGRVLFINTARQQWGAVTALFIKAHTPD